MNTSIPLRAVVVALLLSLLACAHSSSTSGGGGTPTRPRSKPKVEYDSQQLMMKNADEVSAIISRKIKRAQKFQSQQEVNDDIGIISEPEAVDALRDAMRIALARPDQDGSRANMFAQVRRELTDLNSFEDVLQDIADEGIYALKHPATSVRAQGTYVILIENMIAELKPDSKTNALYRKIIEQIRDADIEISDKLKNQMLMRSMGQPISPSVTAESIYPKKK